VNGVTTHGNVSWVLSPCRAYLLRAQCSQCPLHVLVDIAQAAGLALVVSLILSRQVLGQGEGGWGRGERDTGGLHVLGIMKAGIMIGCGVKRYPQTVLASKMAP